MFLGIDRWVKTCRVCGIFAPNHCSKCKSVNYCCRTHQIHDWKSGHKESCGVNQGAIGNSKLLFPEYEIVIEGENAKGDDDDADNFKKEEEEIEKYEKMIKEGDAGTFQNKDVQNELSSMANQKEDETFFEFRSASDKYPDQILRYRLPNKHQIENKNVYS